MQIKIRSQSNLLDIRYCCYQITLWGVTAVLGCLPILSGKLGCYSPHKKRPAKSPSTGVTNRDTPMLKSVKWEMRLATAGAEKENGERDKMSMGVSQPTYRVSLLPIYNITWSDGGLLGRWCLVIGCNRF